MRTCKSCRKKICLKTNKPCKKIEQWMRNQGINSSAWIRPKVSSKKRYEKGKWREIPFSALPTENDSKDPLKGDYGPTI